MAERLHEDEFGHLDARDSLSAIVDAMPDGLVIVNQKGLITFVNGQAKTMFGYEGDELLGQPIELLLPESYRSAHSRQRERYFSKPKQRSMGSGLALFGSRKDGTEFQADVALSAIETEAGFSAIAIIRDISEQKEEDELRKLSASLERQVEARTLELRASEARYTALFHSTDEGFCIIEVIFDDSGKPVDYRFLEINPAFERHTGLTNAVGKTMREIAPEHEEHWFETYGRIASDGEPMRFQNHAEQLNRYYDVYACRVGDPKDLQVAILFNDITEKQQMESDLREAKEGAERANLAKSEFLSRMNHELRTPMNSVLGYAQLLDLEYDDPKIKDAARSILRGGKHLLELINEVLDLSRIESGNFAVSVEPVPLGAVLLQAYGLLAPIANSAGVQLLIEGDLCDTLHVEADRQRLLQVVINLLGNAIKYNKQGGKVAVRCLQLDNGCSRIEIADTGRGISAEDQELLFQPFQRFGDLTTEGTGLGLALSHRLVGLLGGTMGLLESTPNGSTFFIDMKSVQPAYQELAKLGTESSSTVALKGVAGKVLYIEDNLSNVRLIERVFTGWDDLKLIPAMQGMVGLELAREHRPDLILLDVHLPDLAGDRVLERLKSDPATREIPVVVMSADATSSQIKKLLGGGAVEYLTKPIDLEQLFRVLKEQLPAQS